MNITALLNKNCKPIMRRWYKFRYERDIYTVLSLYNRYKDITVDINTAVSILICEDGWDITRAVRAWGICMYCGFLELDTRSD